MSETSQLADAVASFVEQRSNKVKRLQISTLEETIARCITELTGCEHRCSIGEVGFQDSADGSTTQIHLTIKEVPVWLHPRDDGDPF